MPRASFRQSKRSAGWNRGLMKIGLFDHVEHGERPLTTLFDERLNFVQAADEAGFYCLHLAEHHATPLNMVPVPGVFLAAAARETKRIKLGPLVYLLPLYSPLRLTLRTQVPQDRSRPVARYLHRRVQLRQRRSRHRSTDVQRSALQFRE